MLNDERERNEKKPTKNGQGKLQTANQIGMNFDEKIQFRRSDVLDDLIVKSKMIFEEQQQQLWRNHGWSKITTK